MKICVCLKRVPDTATKVRIASDGQSIDPADVQWVISPYDEYALEEALLLREKVGAEELTVVTLGPDAAQQTLRQALAMGADQGILIRCEERLDPYQSACNLAAVLEERGADLILFGRQSVDDGNGQVGPLTARKLGLPCVTEVVGIEIEAGKAVVVREVEGGKEVIEVSLPVALTAQKGKREPRYASLKGIMAAKKKRSEE
ncbi:MAG: electron transfer flavoprotein subunit beta/FixA family protein, partial [Planctomycetota bacterium]